MTEKHKIVHDGCLSDGFCALVVLMQGLKSREKGKGVNTITSAAQTMTLKLSVNSKIPECGNKRTH